VARSNALDKFIAYINPTAGARRARDRLVYERISSIGAKRRYDGASSGRRTDGWVAASTSANAEIRLSLPRLRDRSRDLVRNDPHANRAISVIETNVVDTGIVPRIIGPNKAQIKKASDLWTAWAESTACDFDGKKNFYGLQKVIMRAVAESGEVLVRKRIMRSSSGLPVALQLQVLESDFIDTYSRGGEVLQNGGYIKQGIEFDQDGKIVAYYLWDRHPGEMDVPFRNLTSQRVPAEDIIHVFRLDRVGQIRGVPWLSPVVLKVRDFNDYDDAQLLRQKIAACFAAFVTDPDGADTGTNADGTDLIDKFEPGMIEVLGPGKSVEFANPPAVDGYGEFSRGHLRSIAIGIGITYESMTGDYSQVNYSSGRLGALQMQKNVRDWQWNLMIPAFCDPTFRWFVEIASIGTADISTVSSKWTPPKVDMIDPAKEVSAIKDEVRAGLKSLPEAIRERGDDPDTVLKEIAETNKQLDKLEITLDTDPRKVTAAGMAQIEPSDPAGTENTDKTEANK
jgi:lambda family phage portal protein